MVHQRTREVGRLVVRTGVYSGTVVLKLLRLQPTISRDAVTGREFWVRWWEVKLFHCSCTRCEERSYPEELVRSGLNGLGYTKIRDVLDPGTEGLIYTEEYYRVFTAYQCGETRLGSPKIQVLARRRSESDPDRCSTWIYENSRVQCNGSDNWGNHVAPRLAILA